MSELENSGAASGPVSARPLVARRVGQQGVWLFAGAAVIGGAILFAALSAHRAAITAPAIAPDAEERAATIAEPPPIEIPRDVQDQTQNVAFAAPTQGAPIVIQTPSVPAPPRIVHVTAPPAPAAPIVISTPAPPSYSSAAPAPSGPEVVYQAGRNRPGPSADSGNGPGAKDERVMASRFANPATTVPKGTVMQATLESALDSTRAGFARAIIARDVYGFDGTKVLIPRGSKLIGEYKADLASGQSRALIQWQRLMRPDGVVINLDSPSADPLGRAGVEGKVHSHFMAKFGGAFLQSALNVGTEVGVSKAVGGTSIYAVPLSTTSNATPTIAQNAVQPTLTVKQGTSVSVFVAKDLDFTSVEQ